MVHGVFMLGIREAEEELVKLVLPIQQKEEMEFFLISLEVLLIGEAEEEVQAIVE
jgi:hypothetical protein